MSSLDWIRNHKIWLSLVFVRFCLVFLPQQGYIHPDEFFQSTEIVAGIILMKEILEECYCNLSRHGRESIWLDDQIFTKSLC